MPNRLVRLDLLVDGEDDGPLVETCGDQADDPPLPGGVLVATGCAVFDGASDGEPGEEFDSLMSPTPQHRETTQGGDAD